MYAKGWCAGIGSGCKPVGWPGGKDVGVPCREAGLGMEPMGDWGWDSGGLVSTCVVIREGMAVATDISGCSGWFIGTPEVERCMAGSTAP